MRLANFKWTTYWLYLTRKVKAHSANWQKIRPDEIKLLFNEYGNVRDVHIPIDFNTRQPRGFAYIE